MKFWTTTIAISLFPVFAWSQGELTPPPGPPAKSMRTLLQIEPRIPLESLPYEIEEPGTYYLTKEWDFAGSVSTAIVINASDVTIDMGGFALRRTSSSTIVIAAVNNVHILNGTISNLGAGVVGITGTSASSVKVENVSLHSLGGIAIHLGDSATIIYCAIFNGKGGVSVGKSSLVKDCQFHGHQPEQASDPLDVCVAGPGSLIENCTVRSSKRAFNLNGVEAKGLTIQDCVVGIEMTGGGLRDSRLEGCGTSALTATEATVENVQVSSSAGFGFTLKRSIARNCSATRNGGGFKLVDSQAIDCQATRNSTHGFYAYDSETGPYPGDEDPAQEYVISSLVRGCSATQNQTGFYLSRVSAQNCTAARNTSDGFYALSSTVTDCTSSENGGNGFAGLVLSLGDCLAMGNIHGFQVDRSSLRDCTAADATQIGFFLSECQATRLTARENDQAGIVCGNSTTLTDSLSKHNRNSGITTANRCVLRGNFAEDNGSAEATKWANIFIDGDYNRVEGNHALRAPGSGGNDFGIQLRKASVGPPAVAAVVGNIVIGNSSGGHGPGENYDMPSSGNIIGPILTTGSTTANISSSANANFEL